MRWKGKPLDVFKQGLTWKDLYFTSSRCSVENESERTREQAERPTWKEGEEEKIRANTQPCVNWEAAQ